ncbi:MAG: alpha/beta hydrolase [Pirellulales bacterium]|nr:alpha/beta hydrolase [Pirellulales bacterium]
MSSTLDRIWFLIIVLAAMGSMTPYAQAESFTVTLDQPFNGKITLSPALPPDGEYPGGTKVTVTATPNGGYAFDSGYYSVPGRWGTMYFESMTNPFTITVDRDQRIGASFIEAEELKGFHVIQDVIYAQPGVKPLKYDVYIPDGAKRLPCIVVIHGGGWSTNTEDIMRGLARELVKTNQYVVCSIDYRWLGTLDGDETPNTMVDLIEDVFGAIAHIQEHAEAYGADPGRLAVTGDSAGGHLSAAAANMVNKIGDGGFGVKEGVFEYLPTYMPNGKPAQQVRSTMAKAIRAAAPSYGVFDGDSLRLFVRDVPSGWLKAIAPIENIPNAQERAVPQLLLRGTADMLIRNEPVQAYTDALKAAGQTVEYVQVEGANHAFFDWKPDRRTKETFLKYGVPYAAKMKSFFDAVFCAKP